MSVTIDYSRLSGRLKREKALADCKDWLGEGRFKDVMKLLEFELTRVAPDAARREYLETVLSLGGISGYPARAMIDEAGGFPHDE